MLTDAKGPESLASVFCLFKKKVLLCLASEGWGCYSLFVHSDLCVFIARIGVGCLSGSSGEPAASFRRVFVTGLSAEQGLSFLRALWGEGPSAAAESLCLDLSTRPRSLPSYCVFTLGELSLLYVSSLSLIYIFLCCHY